MLPFVLLGCVWWQHGRVRWKDLLQQCAFLCPCAGPRADDHLVSASPGVGRKYGSPRRISFPPDDGGLGALVLSLQGALAPEPDHHVSQMGYRCLSLDFLRAGDCAGRLLRGVLVETADLGTSSVIWLWLFCGDAVSGAGILRSRLLSLFAGGRSLAVLLHRGVIALAVAAGDWVYRRVGKPGRPWAIAVSGGILVALAAGTWQRSTVYADNQTLWRDNLAKNPKAWAAHDNLGVALGEAGNQNDAISQFQEALRTDPNEPSVHFNLAVVLVSQGKNGEAIAHYEEVLRLDPDRADAYNNLAWLLATAEKSTSADHAQAVQLALKLDRRASYLPRHAGGGVRSGRPLSGSACVR